MKWEGWGKKSIQHKNSLGCMAGVTLVLVCVAVAGLLLGVVNKRGPSIASDRELGEYKRIIMDSCPRVLHVSFLCCPGFSLDWEGMLGVLVRSLRTVRVVYWVNFMWVLVLTYFGCSGEKTS